MALFFYTRFLVVMMLLFVFFVSRPFPGLPRPPPFRFSFLLLQRQIRRLSVIHFPLFFFRTWVRTLPLIQFSYALLIRLQFPSSPPRFIFRNGSPPPSRQYPLFSGEICFPPLEFPDSSRDCLPRTFFSPVSLLPCQSLLLHRF